MKKVFIDTDVVIDFLTKREPFAIESMKIMEYGVRKQIEIHISSLSLNNIHYLISRKENKVIAKNHIKSLMKFIEILSVHRSTMEKAAYSEFKDFEDAVQNYCAEENEIKTFITRNIKDYTKSNLSIQTPREFIVNFESRT